MPQTRSAGSKLRQFQRRHSITASRRTRLSLTPPSSPASQAYAQPLPDRGERLPLRWIALGAATVGLLVWLAWESTVAWTQFLGTVAATGGVQ